MRLPDLNLRGPRIGYVSDDFTLAAVSCAALALLGGVVGSLTFGASLFAFEIGLVLMYFAMRARGVALTRRLRERGYEWVTLQEAMEIEHEHKARVPPDFPPAAEVQVLPGFEPTAAGLASFARDWAERNMREDPIAPNLLRNRVVGRLTRLEAVIVVLFVAATLWLAFQSVSIIEQKRHARALSDAFSFTASDWRILDEWVKENGLEDDPRQIARVEARKRMWAPWGAWAKQPWHVLLVNDLARSRWGLFPVAYVFFAGLLVILIVFRRLLAARLLRLLHARGYDWVDLAIAVRLAEFVTHGWGRELPPAKVFDASGLPCTARALVTFERRHRRWRVRRANAKTPGS